MIDQETIVAVLNGEPRTYEHEGEALKLAWRVTFPDLRSSHDYRWPFPGQWATPASVPGAGNVEYTRGDPCPQFEGDGVCLALSFAGAASGGIPAITGLICAYRESNVLGADTTKLRVSTALVLDVIDIPAIARQGHLYGANLTRANLTWANLTGANLTGANLTGATLYGADLTRANLTGANLTGANLTGANLYGADLTWANLYGAALYGANLTRANLTWANLTGATLYGANLTGANLYGANLTWANLTRATLYGADLTGADLTDTIGYTP